jgi:HEAT repeat protein
VSVWGIVSDVAFDVVVWSCVVLLAVVALIAVQLVVVRVFSVIRVRRQRELERVWLPLLICGLERVPDPLPQLRRRDVRSLLSLWNRVHDAIKGSAKAPLLDLALRIGLDHAARRMFSRRDIRDRLLAITTLGRLADRVMWSELVRLAAAPDLALSLAAARAMVRIDPRSATTLLLPIIADRDDWPPSTVALMLQEAGAEVISEPLVQAVLRVPHERAHRLIRYLGLAHSEAAVPLLNQLIREVESFESVTACLRVFTDANDVDAIQAFLHHPRWEVRVCAVKTLGRIGARRDEVSLIAMLSDPEWWVRYRAAQAVGLVSGDVERVKRLRDTHVDPFARDILTHVLAEQGAA